MGMIGRYFSLAEFERASTRPLSLYQQTKAAELVRAVLDDAREWYGGPLRVTSFVRAGDAGAHGDGSAVDLQPVAGGDAGALRLADYLAERHRPGAGGYVKQVIYEPAEAGQLRAHVHVVTRLVQGASAGYLHEVVRDGRRRYEYAAPGVGALAGGAPAAAGANHGGADAVLAAGVVGALGLLLLVGGGR